MRGDASVYRRKTLRAHRCGQGEGIGYRWIVPQEVLQGNLRQCLPYHLPIRSLLVLRGTRHVTSLLWFCVSDSKLDVEAAVSLNSIDFDSEDGTHKSLQSDLINDMFHRAATTAAAVCFSSTRSGRHVIKKNAIQFIYKGRAYILRVAIV